MEIYNYFYTIVIQNLVEVIMFLVVFILIIAIFDFINSTRSSISSRKTRKRFKELIAEVELLKETSYAQNPNQVEQQLPVERTLFDESNHEEIILEKEVNIVEEPSVQMPRSENIIQELLDEPVIPSSIRRNSDPIIEPLVESTLTKRRVDQEINKLIFEEEQQQTIENMIKVKKKLIQKIIGYKKELEMLSSESNVEVRAIKKKELTSKLIIVKNQLNEYHILEKEISKNK